MTRANRVFRFEPDAPPELLACDVCGGDTRGGVLLCEGALPLRVDRAPCVLFVACHACALEITGVMLRVGADDDDVEVPGGLPS